MTRSYATTLLLAVVVSVTAFPGIVAASGCDPGSGCCGGGQSFVGQQLFSVPYGPSQAATGWTGNLPQSINRPQAAETTSRSRTGPVGTGPIQRQSIQSGRLATSNRAFVWNPMRETLW